MPKIRAHPPLLMAWVSQKGYGYGIRERNHHPISEPKMNRPATTKSQGLREVFEDITMTATYYCSMFFQMPSRSGPTGQTAKRPECPKSDQLSPFRAFCIVQGQIYATWITWSGKKMIQM